MSRARKGSRLTKEHREHISKSLKEHYTDQTAERRSQALKKYYQTHDPPNKGVPHSEETKEKIRQPH